MDILAPWSLATYLPLNGFHPLYRSLIRVRARDVRFITPRKLEFASFSRLVGPEGHLAKVDLASPDWITSLGGKLQFQKFVAAHGIEEIWLQSNLSGDVELHHTAPLTRGDRPFLLHCEAFLPIFLPFFQPGIELELDQAKVDAIRAFYRDMFESRNCLAIVSHLPETLNQISSFFESSIIDSKLVSMPVGLDTPRDPGAPIRAPTPSPRSRCRHRWDSR